MQSIEYCKAQNSGRVKLWQADRFRVLVRKTLVYGKLSSSSTSNGNSHVQQLSGIKTNQQQVTQSMYNYSTMAWPDAFPSSGYVGCHIAMSSSTEYWNENENGILKPAPSYLAIQICN